MNKKSIVKFNPHIRKRPEYSLNRLYLLNFSTNDIWVGNIASFCLISKIDGYKTIEDIVTEALEDFYNCSEEDLYKTSFDIIKELVETGFLTIVN